jgi:hypothetical protein
MGDGLARASIINLPNFPPEACANCEKHKGTRDGLPVAKQKPGESLKQLHL